MRRFLPWPQASKTFTPPICRTCSSAAGVARGLNETARALEKGQAQLAILADDCNQPDYKKLVEALCAENGTPLLSVPEAKQLGQWAGVSILTPPSACSYEKFTWKAF